MKDIFAIARIWGIEPGFYDVFGQWHEANRSILARLIAALSGAHSGRPASISARCRPIRCALIKAMGGDYGHSLYSFTRCARAAIGGMAISAICADGRAAASCGASGVGLNPLHALFPDRAEQASPYAPNSRLYLNLLYIDVEAIPEFPGVATAGLEAEINSLQKSEMVAYARVAQAKLPAYVWLTNGSANRRLRNAARISRLTVKNRAMRSSVLLALNVCASAYAPKPWPQWPQQWRNPDLENLEKFRQAHKDDCEFHEFAQWIADGQLQACKSEAHRRGLSIGLFIDVAVGIDPHGADAWSRQDAVLADVSIGAPPDEFNPAGQNWGLAPFNPHALAANNYEPMRQLMRATMRHAGAIRLDHVLGLMRVYMIPHGFAPAEGAYVRFPFEPLLQVIAEESERLHCIVIGEDLGTVPENFRETLSRWGLWTYRVMMFERERDGRFRPPQSYPVDALATFNTHDLPTFGGWLQSNDLRVKRAIGLDPGETDEARAKSLAALRAILSDYEPAYSPDDFAAVASFLAATRSRLVVVSLDDLLGVVDQINIPGTIDQHPNWRRKLPLDVEDLGSNDGLLRVASVFAQAGRSHAS